MDVCRQGLLLLLLKLGPVTLKGADAECVQVLLGRRLLLDAAFPLKLLDTRIVLYCLFDLFHEVLLSLLELLGFSSEKLFVTLKGEGLGELLGDGEDFLVQVYEQGLYGYAQSRPQLLIKV